MSCGRKQRHFLPVAELTDLYINRLWSSYQLAEHFGCSPPTILLRLKEAGVPVRRVGDCVRGKPPRLNLPIDEMVRLYVDELWPSDKIGERYGCSMPTVLIRLREAGVKVRHHNDTKRGAPSPHRAKVCGRAIVLAYQNSHTSMSEIARSTGCSVQVISRVLDEHGVAHKPLSQVIEGKRNGSANPNWRDDLTDDERANRRDSAAHAKWRAQVYERDGFECVRCGDRAGGNLNAHHLESYNARRDLRWEASNGATLCEDCHLGFHKRFGYGDNTAAQFAEYMNVEGLAA